MLMGRRKKKKNLKSDVWSKSHGLCAKCGKAIPDDKQTIDHFIPKYLGKEYIDELIKYSR